MNRPRARREGKKQNYHGELMNVGFDFDGTIDEFYEEFQFSTPCSRHGAAVASLIRKKDKIDSIQRIFARLIRY
jgi:hypothetical protein